MNCPQRRAAVTRMSALDALPRSIVARSWPLANVDAERAGTARSRFADLDAVAATPDAASLTQSTMRLPRARSSIARGAVPSTADRSAGSPSVPAASMATMRSCVRSVGDPWPVKRWPCNRRRGTARGGEVAGETRWLTAAVHLHVERALMPLLSVALKATAFTGLTPARREQRAGAGALAGVVLDGDVAAWKIHDRGRTGIADVRGQFPSVIAMTRVGAARGVPMQNTLGEAALTPVCAAERAADRAGSVPDSSGPNTPPMSVCALVAGEDAQGSHWSPSVFGSGSPLRLCEPHPESPESSTPHDVGVRRAR